MASKSVKTRPQAVELSPYRLFILGAGFSYHAGIPLAIPLYDKIRKYMCQYKEDAFHFRRDRRKFAKYLKNTLDNNVAYKNIDMEQFLTYLDIEHYLGLKGKDTWSEDGNESQLIIRRAMAQILYEAQADSEKRTQPLYDQFAQKLSPHDRIITFNNDTLLENALDRCGVKYRLVPYKFKSINPDGMGGIIDSENDNDVIVLKMHGSIDWFDLGKFKIERDAHETDPVWNPRPHSNKWIVDEFDRLQAEAVAGTPYENSPLRNIYRCRNLSHLYQYGGQRWTRPVMILPSHAKLAYMEIYKDFWWSFSGLGYRNSQLIIIGYSFPGQDQYALQPLSTAIQNHILHFDIDDYFDRSKVKIVDFAETQAAQDQFRSKFPYLNPENSIFFLKGFGDNFLDKLDEIIEPSRYRMGSFEQTFAGTQSSDEPDSKS